MRINADVKFVGGKNEIIITSIIDTGAEISIMPSNIASYIGAWITYDQTGIIGVHEDIEYYPIIISDVYFPSLNQIGGKFRFAVSEKAHEPLIGLDILKPLGVSIDTRTGHLHVKNEIWEAFKTLSGIGVISYFFYKLFEGSEADDWHRR